MTGTPLSWQDAIDPVCLSFEAEQEAATAALAVSGARTPSPGMFNAAQLRRARLWTAEGTFRPLLSTIGHDDHISTAAGDIPVRIFPGDLARTIILHFHGGGWVLGSIHEQDALLEDLSRRTGATIISIAYPLAPEHELPEALAASRAAAAALIEAHPDHQIGVVGESAGAQIALQTIRALCGAYPQIVAAALAYGIYDLSMTPSQRTWGTAFIGLSTDWLQWFYDQALPGRTSAERAASDWSPLNANLAGLPPIQLGIGTRDPLFDDSLLLAGRLREAGNNVTLRVYPAACHGFNHLDTAMARHANTVTAEFLSHRLRQPPRNR